ncbi:Nicotinamide/nicotinic acid mononucleotide adenylyltransferase 2 [Galemys pyrenaicus]|uniref:Nicotinamide/nicotinic acid mononucleotide adenylyltransferase 2 n=1 Tax=Galemys pyrenaicus TaxID=202257 RepID=A0A8J6DQU7_GALPY|nr:Nicotinamide/nicotinic acid mononucleotide adenylyltransferase 2 [Galemys pyrenaicus]
MPASSSILRLVSGPHSDGLVSSRHRLIMCQLAVQNSDWIRVDPWECYQDTWQTTCSVLEHHRDLMKVNGAVARDGWTAEARQPLGRCSCRLPGVCCLLLSCATWPRALTLHSCLPQRVTGCILSNVNTPSMTPVIGQPQNETPQPIYQNNNVPVKPTAAEILGKVGESLRRICCVRPPVERFTFVDENANLGTVMRYEEIELRILLLCGSDLLESFCIPGLWNEADVSSKVTAGWGAPGSDCEPKALNLSMTGDGRSGTPSYNAFSQLFYFGDTRVPVAALALAMEVIVGDFGIVVVPRDAADTDRIMNHSSILRKYKNNIMVVKDDINHPMSVVSSTKSRLALQHGDGHVVDYLSQPVIDYILKSQLYINASG